MWYYSPMEQFETKIIFSQPTFTITNIQFFLIIATMITIQITKPKRNEELVASWWGIQNESLYRTIQNMVVNFIGPKYTIYFPQIYTLFNIIVFTNLLGLLPYSSTPTVEFVMTQSISFTLCMGILLIGIITHNWYIFAAFIPSGTPQALVFVMLLLEILAYIIKIVSLGLRQAINLTTGHVLIKVIISFVYGAYLKGTSIFILAIPLAILALFGALEILVAYLQAYIITFITCITFKDMA